jgi:hypothetical protein
MTTGVFGFHLRRFLAGGPRPPQPVVERAIRRPKAEPRRWRFSAEGKNTIEVHAQTKSEARALVKVEWGIRRKDSLPRCVVREV